MEGPDRRPRPIQVPGAVPDLYSVKVTLATFVPALKTKTSWCSLGNASVLNVNLNTLFSTIQLSYPSVEAAVS